MGIDLDIHPDQLVGLIRRSERLQLVSRAGGARIAEATRTRRGGRETQHSDVQSAAQPTQKLTHAESSGHRRHQSLVSDPTDVQYHQCDQRCEREHHAAHAIGKVRGRLVDALGVKEPTDNQGDGGDGHEP